MNFGCTRSAALWSAGNLPKTALKSISACFHSYGQTKPRNNPGLLFYKRLAMRNQRGARTPAREAKPMSASPVPTTTHAYAELPPSATQSHQAERGNRQLDVSSCLLCLYNSTQPILTVASANDFRASTRV